MMKRALRWLLLLLAVLLVAAVCGTATWALRTTPWQRMVPYSPDFEAQAEDAELVRDAVGELPAASGLGPDIVLIVLDTVRADHLELYGYQHSTMPRLAAWAEAGMVHDNFSSTSSWTLPSHASLFTGQYPATHGAHGRTVEEGHLRKFMTGQATRRMLEHPLRASAVTVAERLWDAGYATLGIAANRAFLDKSWRLHQGFDLWICEDAGRGASYLPYTRADRITAMALEAVDQALPGLAYPEQPGRAPLFLFLNYMEAHGPYVPREGYTRDPSKLVLHRRKGRSREKLAWKVLAGRTPLPEDVKQGWIEAYDADLRFLDEQLAVLLEGLEARGIGPDAHIIILSDHDEYFGEHNLLAHSKDIYQPGVRVPLVVRGPDVPAGRSDEPLQIQDLAHRIVSVADAEPLPRPEPTGELQVAEIYGSRGRDLRNPRFGDRFNRVRRSFRRGDHELILGSDGSMEAYDLATDPDELVDLSDQPWAQALMEEAKAWMEARGVDDGAPAQEGEEGEDIELSDDKLEALRALGYVE